MNSSTAFKPKLLAISVAACFAVSAQAGSTLPTGATGVVGVTGISTAGSTLTVNTTGNSVLNYTSFSIGAGATVQINQQSSAFASLQRVIGAGGVIPQSVIDGMLQSNGRVFLLNPSGIVIGAGARIDVAGFVASSLNMSDDDFLKGRLRFTENPGAKAVKNFGEITTTKGGSVYLVAPEVENHGIIRAPQGQILLAAGKSAELVSDASPYITVKIVADTEKALNVGQLIADSGSIGIFGALVQHSGVAEASGAVVGAGGQIRFIATKDLTIDAGSRIAANGTSGGKIVLQAEGGTNLIGGTVEATGSSGKGGEIQALGVRVGVVGHGIIDASGEAGGGTVLVGGDYQGKNSAIQNAERTYIGADGVIRADAGANGDGGRVIVWADGDTRFYGSISAQGGSQSGNGGFVETSGKGHLVALGSVSAGAQHGKNGTWLLDPTDIDIVAAGYGTEDSAITSTTPYGQLLFGDDPSGNGTSKISVSGITTAMQQGANVNLQATNDITISADVNTSAQPQSLTLNAMHNIAFNVNPASGSGYGIVTGGDLTLAAGNMITGFATNTAATLQSTGGSVTLAGLVSLPGSLSVSAAQSIVTQTIDITSDNATVQLNAGGSISAGSITAKTFISDSSNNVLLNASGSVVVGDVTTSGGQILIGAGSDVTTGTLRTTGTHPESGSTFGANGGSVTLTTNTGRIMVGGDIDTRGATNPYGPGGNGGLVTLRRTASSDPGTAVTVTGMIMTGGGTSFTSTFGSGQTGGSGGAVNVSGSYGFMYGAINIGGIDTQGGGGGASAYAGPGGFFGGDGGRGGDVGIYGYGGVGIGSINASGGTGGAGFLASNSGGFGGDGGAVTVNGGSIGSGGFFVSAGGAGGSSESGFFGGSGGGGGSITLNSPGSIVVGILDTSGGPGGVAPSGVGGFGGFGGSINVTGGSVTVGLASSRGGAGGDGAEGGAGGFGGPVTLKGTSFVVAGIVDVSGGNAGASSMGSGVGDDGGQGGVFTIGSSTTDMVSVGFIKARGGDGNGTGWNGGGGGFGTVQAVTNIVLGPKPPVGQSQTVVDVSGGNGTSGAGGGNGGSLGLDPIGMTINGVLAGTGGAGVTPGNGGEITFATTGGTGVINFVNGGWDLTAGAGGIDGSISGAGAIPAQLDVARFVFVGPGDMADIPVTGVGIFRFTALADVLSNPALLQSVGVTQFEAQKTAESSGDGSSGEKEEKGKEKTGSLGSCRPS